MGVGKCGGGWRWVVGSDRYRASSAPLDLALGKNHLMVPFLDQFQGLKEKLLISCQSNQHTEKMIVCNIEHF